MKYGNDYATNGRIWRPAALLAIAAMLFTSEGLRGEEIEEIRETPLVVNIEDPYGLFSVDAEWIREDLLEHAFYEAADRFKLDDFEIVYNGVVPKNARSYLEFRVISWRRSVANMYEFTAAGKYHNADGDEINLGVFRGYRSGIDVFMRRDIADHFADSAEDAFYQALKTLKKKLS